MSDGSNLFCGWLHCLIGRVVGTEELSGVSCALRSTAKVGLSAPHSSLGEEALLERWRALLPKNSDTGSMHLTGGVRCTRLNSVPECTARVPECTARVPEWTAAFRATPRETVEWILTKSRGDARLAGC